METYALTSFGKIKLAGSIALVTGLANTAISLIVLSQGDVSAGLLGTAMGGSLIASGVGLITARRIAQFLLWSKVYGLTILLGSAGSYFITGQLSSIGFLPAVGLLVILLIFNRMVKADVVTSRSLIAAKERVLV